MARIALLAVVVAVLALVGCKKPTTQPTDVSVQERPVSEIAPESTYEEGTGGTESSRSTNVSTLATPPAKDTESHATAPERSTYSPPEAARTYTVQRGDTLSSIARKVYGDQKRYKDIAQANNMSDPNKLHIGQVLTLP